MLKMLYSKIKSKVSKLRDSWLIPNSSLMNACESILGLSPYQGGKPIEELARELGLTKISKLASNEKPFRNKH